jgi:hypothetical protein
MRISLMTFAFLFLFHVIAPADMYLQGLGTDHAMSVTNDRFYVGADKSFVGQGYDWSGVGENQVGQWATMISPSYFISAGHYTPTPGDTITFHADNDPSSTAYKFTVDSGIHVPGITDVYLGHLATPIPSSDHITTYPLWTLPTLSSYIGKDIFVYGRPNRVGRNVISYVEVAGGYDPMYYPFSVMDGGGPDEAYLVSGDSGGPSFGYVNGHLALVGEHSSDSDGAIPGGQRMVMRFFFTLICQHHPIVHGRRNVTHHVTEFGVG